MSSNSLKSKYLQILETIFGSKQKYAELYGSILQRIEESESYLLERARLLVVFVNSSEANKQHFLNMKIKLFYKDNSPPAVVERVSCKKMLTDYPHLWEHLHYLYVLYESKNKERDREYWKALMHLIQLSHDNLKETRDILDNMLNDITAIWAGVLKTDNEKEFYKAKRVKRLLLDTLLRTSNLINRKYRGYFVSGQFNTAIIRKNIIRWSPMIAKNMEFFDRFIQPLEYMLEHVGKNGVDFKSYQDKIEEKLTQWMADFKIDENDDIRQAGEKLFASTGSKIGVQTINSKLSEYTGMFKSISNADEYLEQFFGNAMVQNMLVQLKVDPVELRKNTLELFEEVRAVELDSLEKVPGVVETFLVKYNFQDNIIGSYVRSMVKKLVATIVNEGEVDLSKLEGKLKEIGMTREEVLEMLQDESADVSDLKARLNNWIHDFIDEDYVEADLLDE